MGASNDFTIDSSSSISSSTAATDGGVIYSIATGAITFTLSGSISLSIATAGSGAIAFFSGGS